MRIETSAGDSFEIRAICTLLRNKNRLLIEMDDALPFHEIIMDFDGLEFIRKEDGETYEGFTHLVGIYRTEEGFVRLTLEKD